MIIMIIVVAFPKGSDFLMYSCLKCFYIIILYFYMTNLRGEILPFLQVFKKSLVELTTFLKHSENSSSTLERCLARDELAEIIRLSRTRLEQYKNEPGVSVIKTEIEELSNMVEDAVELAKEFDDLCGHELDLSGPLSPITYTSHKRSRDEEKNTMFEQDVKRHKKFESDQKVHEHEYLTKNLGELSHFLTSWIDHMDDFNKHLADEIKKKNYDSVCHLRILLEGDLVNMSNLMRTNEDMLKRAQEIYGSPRLMVRGGVDLVDPVQLVFTQVKETKSKMGRLLNMIDETTFALEEWSMDAKYDCSNSKPPTTMFGGIKRVIKPPPPPPPSYDVSDIPELEHVSNSRRKSVTEDDLRQKLMEIRLKDLLDDDVSKKKEIVSKINNYNTNLAVIKSIEGKIEQKMKEISAQSKAVKAKIVKKQPIIGDRKNRMSIDQILQNLEELDTFTGDKRSLDGITMDSNLPEVI